MGRARIVGLGEAAHRLAEVTTLKQRALQYLVERMGFRSIAWEDDWSLGTQINDYVLGRRDDRDALVGQMSRTAWRTREVADVLTWLRAWNDTHRDKVRFFGVEYFATRPFAYDRVEEYVADAAPDLLPQVQERLSFLQPFTDDMGEYLEWFRDEVDDKPAYVRSAELLQDLVASIPHRPGDRDHALAEHRPGRSAPSTPPSPSRTTTPSVTRGQRRTCAGGSVSAGTRSSTGRRPRTPPTCPT